MTLESLLAGSMKEGWVIDYNSNLLPGKNKQEEM